MKKKSGFTLIEIIIVLFVIGILALLGLGVNRSNLKTLKSNNTIEEIKSDFDSFFLQILNSSDFAGIKYTESVLSIKKDDFSPLSIQFIPDPEQKKQGTSAIHSHPEKISSHFFSNIGKFEILDISSHQRSYEQIDLVYKKYKSSCKIETKQEKEPHLHQINFSLLPKGGKIVCFSINSNHCRLEQIKCEDFNQKNVKAE